MSTSISSRTSCASSSISCSRRTALLTGRSRPGPRGRDPRAVTRTLSLRSTEPLRTVAFIMNARLVCKFRKCALFHLSPLRVPRGAFSLLAVWFELGWVLQISALICLPLNDERCARLSRHRARHGLAVGASVSFVDCVQAETTDVLSTPSTRCARVRRARGKVRGGGGSPRQSRARGAPGSCSCHPSELLFGACRSDRRTLGAERIALGAVSRNLD